MVIWHVPIASLTVEVRVCRAVDTDVAPVREIAHKADQRRAAVPHVAAQPPQNVRQGIEVPIAGDHFLDDGVQRQMPISSHFGPINAERYPPSSPSQGKDRYFFSAIFVPEGMEEGVSKRGDSD